MTRSTRFASDTVVSVERSRGEIEKILARFGADQFGYASSVNLAQIMFRARGRMIRFELPLTWDNARGKVTRLDREFAQLERSAWRALVLSIKAKVVAVESGIVSFEVEFMPQTVMPDGRTVAQHALPAIEQSYTSRKPQTLLPHFPEST